MSNHHLLYVSAGERNSNRIWEAIVQKKMEDVFQVMDITQLRSIPPQIQVVPTIVLMQSDKILSGTKAFQWVAEYSAGQGGLQQNIGTLEQGFSSPYTTLDGKIVGSNDSIHHADVGNWQSFKIETPDADGAPTPQGQRTPGGQRGMQQQPMQAPVYDPMAL